MLPLICAGYTTQRIIQLMCSPFEVDAGRMKLREHLLVSEPGVIVDGIDKRGDCTAGTDIRAA